MAEWPGVGGMSVLRAALRGVWRGSVALGVAAALSACATLHSPGQHARQFVSSAVAGAYIPLEGSAGFFREGIAAATVIAPGIAVTDAHNVDLVDAKSVIGISRDYDLMFFRTVRRQVPPQGEPRPGMPVIAYGHGAEGDVREAEGPVRWLDAEVKARCPACPVQAAFTYEAQGGEGFSGGPVIDLHTGALVGITFGYRDGLDDRHPAQRLMYAYDLKRVFAELKKLDPQALR